jgi:hypothetical protein
MIREAVIDGPYRYRLSRVWAAGDLVAWIMLNPSTADAEQDDQTIRTCVRLARSWGYGGILVANLFAWRATSPRDLLMQPEPNGPDADAWLLRVAGEAATVVCAWGNHGRHRGRAAEVLRLLAGRRLHHVGMTGAGQPRHPLYLPNDTKMQMLEE